MVIVCVGAWRDVVIICLCVFGGLSAFVRSGLWLLCKEWAVVAL